MQDHNELARMYDKLLLKMAHADQQYIGVGAGAQLKRRHRKLGGIGSAGALIGGRRARAPVLPKLPPIHLRAGARRRRLGGMTSAGALVGGRRRRMHKRAGVFKGNANLQAGLAAYRRFLADAKAEGYSHREALDLWREAHPNPLREKRRIAARKKKAKAKQEKKYLAELEKLLR